MRLGSSCLRCARGSIALHCIGGLRLPASIVWQLWDDILVNGGGAGCMTGGPRAAMWALTPCAPPPRRRWAAGSGRWCGTGSLDWRQWSSGCGR